MKLKEYAQKLGISYVTAYRHFKDGKIEGAYQLDSGTIIIPEDKFSVIHSGEVELIILDKNFDKTLLVEKLHKLIEKLEND